MALSDLGQGVARLLFAAGAIKVSREQPFFLAAGWASPVYVDVRLLIGEPELRKEVTNLAAQFANETLSSASFDAVAGAETAGIAFSAWFADSVGCKLRYVRKRPLGAGRNAQIEGGDVHGMHVLLLDDLTTDGASKIKFARGLRSAGAIVDHVLTIFYHDAFPGAEQRLADAGLTLHSLATWKHILSADSGGRLGDADRAEIETFLKDPVTWSMRHGGRASMTPRI